MRTFILTLLALITFAPVTFSQDLIWPISGSAASDLPFSSTFGPRLKASENYRYDFHRGVDIPAAEGTLVYAVADGTVRLAGEYSYYPNGSPLVQIRHSDPSGGYFYSNYMHLSSWNVAENAQVSQGDLIGLTGVGASGFQHLHFEIRDGGIYQYNCVHPLDWLLYTDTTAQEIAIDSVDVSDPYSPVIEFTVSLPSYEPDLNWVEVRVYDASRKKAVKVDEHFFDMEEWNSWYTAPDALDDPDLDGIVISPAAFNTSSGRYEISFQFYDLPGASKISFEIEAIDVMWNSVKARWPAKGSRGKGKNR